MPPQPSACSRAASTNARPAPPDNHSAATSVVLPSGPCCTSWWRATRSPCSPNCATPIRTAAASRGTSSASSRPTYAAASSRMASRACAPRPARTRSSSHSAASDVASARVARRDAWPTPQRSRHRSAFGRSGSARGTVPPDEANQFPRDRWSSTEAERRRADLGEQERDGEGVGYEDRAELAG
jgi:hypothetical protein